ncbi:hypothetical protein BDP27DRAFT_1325720 [Rhodocollybia butyracea]|uniref:Uncharacterized protein n=1 Tax=Rhodocollybia butyracea TaxID=206335 RepID=A0A9P5PUE6_9AGAR|nr:hypothetical protein BDP27DRAFT_1325720 [Rhodocollybia butyracea]
MRTTPFFSFRLRSRARRVQRVWTQRQCIPEILSSEMIRECLDADEWDEISRSDRPSLKIFCKDFVQS